MKKTILTGDRPTGPLHIGHYFGSLQNRAKLQDDYDTYIMIADVQALTDNYDNPEKVRANVREVTIDNIASGVDPNKVTFFIQSMVPPIAELTVFFSNLVTLARLERNPTIKQEIAEKQHIFKGGVTYGFLGYPISQAADILAFKAELVPVGDDQLPMIEQTREIAHKFNNIYGQTFPEPQALVGDFPRIKGLDGNAKMGKSLGNAIYLGDSPEVISDKVRGALTDTAKAKRNDPGNPDVCTVFSYHKVFSPEALAEIEAGCRQGSLGCVECKQRLAANITAKLAPIRAKRLELEANPQIIDEILANGTKKAQAKAKQTMTEVKQKMKIDYWPE